MTRLARRGTSLIDLLLSIAIVAVLFGGIYLVYFSLITAIANISVRTAAAAAVQGEIETIRNLPYDSVGTLGGIPAGLIPQSQTVSVGAYSFALHVTVRNIDDPLDGTVSGDPPPVDTAPSDYKLVEIEATCPLCNNFGSTNLTTTVAPKALESAAQNGSLFLYAIDANGNPVSGATVQVINPSVAPSINLTDTTNASGVLQLVGVPTSTQGYQVIVTKPGYSTDRTYPLGAPLNPNPAKPNLTVAAQTVTAATFIIDGLSSLTVHTSDNRCVPIGGGSFSLYGSKLIGTNPDVLKFSTTSATDATGFLAIPNLEWDTYTLTLNNAAKNLVGTIPLSPLVVNPSSTADFRFVVQPAANPSLLVTAVDSITGAGIPNASVTVSNGGFSQSLTAGHAFITQGDWSSSQYASQSGGLDADSYPGELSLSLNTSGTYNVGVTEWLISNTFDLGGSSSTLYSISWNPAEQPPQTGAGSLAFQIAANNDNMTWNFIGPDGTSESYFTSSSSVLPLLLSGNRYLRYKVYLSTADENATPDLHDVSFEFSADCVPPARALFTDLLQGSYTIDLTATNYVAGSTTIEVGGGAQSATIPLNREP